MQRFVAATVLLLLASCALPEQNSLINARLATLLPADVLLLGEQHDAAEHQNIHRQVIEALAARGTLAAVVLEMAPQGGSTRKVATAASESAVQTALRWSDGSWPWIRYASAVMAAVRAGVPVLGGNLPRVQLRAAMANAQLDAMLPESALKAQQQAIRLGHCQLLPETQIAPLTRIQIARDRAIAQTITQLITPGKTVLLLAGAGHIDRQRGVPQHLPAQIKAKAIALQAGALSNPSITADAAWVTPAPPAKDYCAQLRRHSAP